MGKAFLWSFLSGVSEPVGAALDWTLAACGTIENQFVKEVNL